MTFLASCGEIQLIYETFVLTLTTREGNVTMQIAPKFVHSSFDA